MPTTPKGFAVKARGRALIASTRQLFAGMKSGLRAKQPTVTAELLSPVATQRTDAFAQIDQAARNGFVPDAHVLRLYDSHVAELDEKRCELGETEADYQAGLRRLDAMFPEPLGPLPEPPTPPAPKNYPLIGGLFGGNGKAGALH